MKIRHLQYIKEITHLPEEQTKLLLGMVALYCLEEKLTTIEELKAIQQNMNDNLKKRGKI